jgi:hypothetical protein
MIATCLITNAQVRDTVSPKVQPCGTGTPSLEWDRAFSKQLQQFKQERVAGRVSNTTHMIPVVVHILHDGDPVGNDENISFAQVQSQIDVLNRDFAGTNIDIVNVPAIFQPVKAGNTGIQFCLAKTDPDGNELSEYGIDRINWKEKDWDNPGLLLTEKQIRNYFDLIVKPKTIWDPKKYLNIWISDRLGFDIYALFGYATFPFFNPNNIPFPEVPSFSNTSFVENYNTCGLWIYHASFGTIGTALLSNHKRGRITTHELGHWLGVYHTFENFLSPSTCNGGNTCSIYGDRCCDTPPQSTANSNCVAYNYCKESPIDTVDMFMNYMDYTTDECRIMFTKDQAERMKNTMTYGVFRNTLNSSTACTDCPELVVINQTASRATVLPGESLTVRFIERARGIVSSGPNIVSIHLSENDILTPGTNGDLYLDEVAVNQILQPNTQTQLLNKIITIPANTTPGIYYIFFSADGGQQVSECVEDNNFATVKITVLGECGDLIVTETGANPNSVLAGSSLTVQCKVKNQGNTPVNPTHYVNIHLSDDDILTPGLNGDIYLNEIPVTVSLVSQEITPLLSAQIQIPSWVMAGTYYIFFAADGRGQVQECDNTNNFTTTIINVSGGGGSNPSTQPIQSYFYWFDDQFSNRTTVSNISSNNFSLQLGVSTNALQAGLHMITLGFADRNNKRSSLLSQFFYKINETYPLGFSKYEYWIDNDFDNKEIEFISPVTNSIILGNIFTNNIAAALHSFNIRFKPDGKNWSSTLTSFFYKINEVVPAGNAQYEYWFDNEYQNRVMSTISSTNNLILLNDLSISALTTGLHTFHIRFKPDGKHWSSVTSQFFYKLLSNTGPIRKWQYWIDNDVQNIQTTTVSETQSLDLLAGINIQNHSSGLHTFHIRFENTASGWSSVSSSFFYKPHVLQVNQLKVKAYRYWFNNQQNNRTEITLPALVDPLEIWKDICTPELLTGKHSIHLQFMDSLNIWSTVLSDTFSKPSPVSPYITASEPLNFCEGNTVTLSALDCSGCTYQWSNGATSRSIVVNQAGNYFVKIHYDNSCIQISDTLIITVNPKPVQPGLVNGNISVTTGQSLPYSIALIPGAANYNWTLSGGGTITSGQGTASVNINWGMSGNYILSVKAVNNCGESMSRDLSIIVSPATAVSNLDNRFELRINPNPSTGIFYLKLSKTANKKASIQIVNNLGQIVYSLKQTIQINEFVQKLDLSSRSSGVYHIKVIIDNSIYVRKLIKQ